MYCTQNYKKNEHESNVVNRTNDFIRYCRLTRNTREKMFFHHKKKKNIYIMLCLHRKIK